MRHDIVVLGLGGVITHEARMSHPCPLEQAAIARQQHTICFVADRGQPGIVAVVGIGHVETGQA